MCSFSLLLKLKSCRSLISSQCNDQTGISSREVIYLQCHLEYHICDHSIFFALMPPHIKYVDSPCTSKIFSFVASLFHLHFFPILLQVSLPCIKQHTRHVPFLFPWVSHANVKVWVTSTIIYVKPATNGFCWRKP